MDKIINEYLIKTKKPKINTIEKEKKKKNIIPKIKYIK